MKPTANSQLQNLEVELRTYLQTKNQAALGSKLKVSHPADIAQAIENLNPPQRQQAFDALATELQAEVLNEFSSTVARQVLDKLPIGDIAALLNRLPMDEAARMVAMFRMRRARILQAMDARHAADVRRLLAYPRESAGRMMTEQFATVRPNMTAQQVLTRLRKLNANVETLTNLYVVDARGKLVGVVSLREVVVAPAQDKVKNLMNANVISVKPQDDREVVAQLLSHYDFLAIPVVTKDAKMLGVITADDVIDVLAAENAEDLLKFGAVGSAGMAEESYFNIPITTVITRRLGWLLLLFVAGTLTGSVLRFFEKELAAVVALSFFIPLLIGTGGNTGAQTVSTLIRGLATGDVQMKDIWRVVRREFFSGILLGSILGIVAFLRAYLWSPDPALALAVGLAILAICAWANTIAALIPLLAQRFKIDPAAVSAPLITTLVDATGLAIYLFIAKASLGL